GWQAKAPAPPKRKPFRINVGQTLPSVNPAIPAISSHLLRERSLRHAADFCGECSSPIQRTLYTRSSSMQLHTIDWIIAFCCVAICFLPALFFGKRSGKSTAEFFASGRSVPCWLAGISMVATTFSSDTPNLVANFVRTQGVAGNWQWWAFTLTGVSTVFFYARLWRRSGVLTDLEFYEVRYSGGAANSVRRFRAVYLGLLFHYMIL